MPAHSDSLAAMFAENLQAADYGTEHAVTDYTKERTIMKKKSTDELLKIIEKERYLNAFLEDYSEELEDISLSEELTCLLARYHLAKSQVIRNSLLDKTYTYQIFDGKREKPSHGKLLALCLAAGFTLDETQRVLRLGHAEQLHPRNVRDCVIIHALNQHISVLETNEVLYDMKKELLE